MSKILIAGAGQIGSRYLQGLLKSKSPRNITALDPSEYSLKVAKSRVEEIKKFDCIHRVSYVNSIHDLHLDYDLAIIATSSFPRSDLIYELSTATNIKYWIVEKVLAPSLSELTKIADATKKSKGVWVNHWLRLQPWTEIIRKRIKLKNAEHLTMVVSGGNIGIACNGTHYIDLLVWLTGAQIQKVNTEQLDKSWFEGKRSGYFEINGTLKVELSNNINLQIISEDSKEPVTIRFEWPDGDYILVTFQNDAGFHVVDRQGIEYEFEPALQSGWMTSAVVDGILNGNQSKISTLKEGIEVHQYFLKSLINHWNFCNKVSITRIPIT